MGWISFAALCFASLAPGVSGTKPVPQKDDRPAIRWEPSWDDAFQRASKENRPVFIAINMDGEDANEEAAEKLYRDEKVVEATEMTVNLIASAATHSYTLLDLGNGVKKKVCNRFKSGISCEEHQEIDKRLRKEYFKNVDEVVAPQHLAVKPNGLLIDQKQYQISGKQIIQLLNEARKTVGKPIPAKPPTPQQGNKEQKSAKKS